MNAVRRHDKLGTPDAAIGHLDLRGAAGADARHRGPQIEGHVLAPGCPGQQIDQIGAVHEEIALVRAQPPEVKPRHLAPGGTVA